VRDLANASVFFDFDGTISTDDIGVYLLERLATGDWRGLDDLYAAGVIGSRECMVKQWACIPDSVDEATRHAVAAEVALDPAIRPLIEGLRALGAEVAVVSDGFGYYVHDRIDPFGVPVFTNEVDFTTNTMRFPNANPDCRECAECGTCKRRFIEDAAGRGRTTVFVGDGTSDRHAARAADVVFATKSLASWCTDEGIAFTHFDSLGEVAAALELPSRE
jgi:2,3-diketo-5-methylthio-1-phosphopentane phosphatase